MICLSAEVTCRCRLALLRKELIKHLKECPLALVCCGKRRPNTGRLVESCVAQFPRQDQDLHVQCRYEPAAEPVKFQVGSSVDVFCAYNDIQPAQIVELSLCAETNKIGLSFELLRNPNQLFSILLDSPQAARRDQPSAADHKISDEPSKETGNWRVESDPVFTALHQRFAPYRVYSRFRPEVGSLIKIRHQNKWCKASVVRVDKHTQLYTTITKPHPQPQPQHKAQPPKDEKHEGVKPVIAIVARDDKTEIPAQDGKRDEIIVDELDTDQWRPIGHEDESDLSVGQVYLLKCQNPERVVVCIRHIDLDTITFDVIDQLSAVDTSSVILPYGRDTFDLLHSLAVETP